jgi:ubiquinone/menaquinone biosynthesis C-methylase UbiE
MLTVFLSGADSPPDETPDKDSPELYVWREEHDPNGIGKFYMGREIAHVMGFGGAGWLDRSTREEQEKLSLMVKLLEIEPGMTVADIGAGSGRISFLMAEQVGPKGKVLAVDIQDEMLELIENRATAKKLTQVVPVKGEIKKTGIEPGTVDLIVMVDVYHEFSHPHEMMTDMARTLKPGGRIAWVEYRLEDPEVPIKLVHKMAETQVKKEAGRKEFGLEFVKTIDKLPQQHIVIYERPKAK